MKKIKVIFSYLLIVALSWACSDSTTTSKVSASTGSSGFVEVPEWLGIYQDTLPCADCKGTLTWLDLKKDNSYKKSIILLGKEPIFDYTFGTTGRWKFDAAKNLVWLDSAAEGKKIGFLIRGDSVLISCDANGKEMNGPHNMLERRSPKPL
jgi:uncharacterized lipoprotein NlpE involved in copper resistance